MSPATPACRRCGHALTGPYCAHCGQRRAEPLTLPRLWAEAVGRISDLDLRLWRTIRALSLRPGWMIREYLEGNRATWTHPGKYMFWMATLYALVLAFLVDPAQLTVRFFDQTVSRQELLLFMGAIAYLAFLYLLITGAAAWGLVRPAIGSVAEGYVALLYVYGHALLVLSLVAALGHWHPLTVRGFLLVYMTWAVAQLAGGSRWKGIIKGVLVYLVYTLTSILVVSGFFFAYGRVFGAPG